MLLKKSFVRNNVVLRRIEVNSAPDIIVGCEYCSYNKFMRGCTASLRIHKFCTDYLSDRKKDTVLEKIRRGNYRYINPRFKYAPKETIYKK